MTAFIEGDHVLVSDPALASTLMNKGCFCKPVRPNGLCLSIAEAAYLVGAGRLAVSSSLYGPILDLRDLIGIGIRSKQRFLEGLLVLRDLRNRGLMVKESGDDELLVHPRGSRSLSSRPDSSFLVRKETDTTDLLELLKGTVRKSRTGLRTVVSVVDGDWDVTHYEIKEALRPPRKRKGQPTGLENILTSVEMPGGISLARTKDRPVEGTGSFMGTDVDGVLMMSHDEASVLGRANEPSDLGSITFRHIVYRDLLGRGWLPKTGFKYGTHFRVYTSGRMEGHSELLVHCFDRSERPSWEALSRAIRLSHSVRKRMVIALIGPGSDLERPVPSYLEMEWTRP